MRKIPLGVSIGLMAITAAVTFVVTSNVTLKMFNEKIKDVNEKQGFYRKLSEIDNYVRSHYSGDIEETQLIDGMISGYISGIGDDNARYISAEEYARLQSEQSGVSDGLGFTFEKDSGGYILVKEVTPGSSSEEAGLQSGDVITAVNNTDVIAYAGGYDEAISLFSAAEGTRVKLYVKRTDESGSNTFISYDVVSQQTEQATVSGRMIGDSGYIKISSLTDMTGRQLKKTLDELLEAGAQGLVFDLRNCTGGTAESLQSALDHILGEGDIVTAYYKNGTEQVVVSCTEAETLKMPMSVIVNQGTKGCSELFAFALRDYASAHTVGRTTAGQGSLLTPYTCSDSTVVILSTASLRTKESGDFNFKGLKPEFEVALPEDIDLNTISNEAAELTDSQLIKALEVTVPQPEEPAEAVSAADE